MSDNNEKEVIELTKHIFEYVDGVVAGFHKNETEAPNSKFIKLASSDCSELIKPVSHNVGLAEYLVSIGYSKKEE